MNFKVLVSTMTVTVASFAVTPKINPMRMDTELRFEVVRSFKADGIWNRLRAGAKPDVRVSVRNGAVTLQGVVQSELDRNVASRCARRVPGVEHVQNDLIVRK